MQISPLGTDYLLLSISQYKCVQYLPQFTEISTPIEGSCRGSKKDTSLNVNPTLLCDFYEHHKPILHRLATILHNTADRQATDREREREREQAIGTDRQCSINVGLMNYFDIL